MSDALAELTRNLGLRKPGSSDLVSLTNDFNNNWDIIDTKLGPADEPWISFVPAWTALTTNPVLGNGTFNGWYLKLGSLVIAKYRLVMGTTTTFGSGYWRWSLPFTYVGGSLYGNLFATDTSAPAFWPGMVSNRISGGVVPGSAIRLLSTAGNMTAISPFTWASTDVLEGTVVFEAAP